MSFVLDTDTCSAYLRGNRAVEGKFLQYTGGLCVSIVTLAELYTWAHRGTDPLKRMDSLERLLSDVEVLTLDDATARLYGQVDAALLARGTTVATPDLLIAATALVHNFTIVTHNVKHFAPVPDLRIQDWLT